MLELARPQLSQQRPTFDLLGRNRDLLQGVFIKRQVDQTGQKPCCRTQMSVVPIGNKFITYGGTAINVFNDIRSLDSVDFEWKVLQENELINDFAGRFGHSGCAFERYIVIFGGCGPYNNKLKTRASYQDIVFFDIEMLTYVKFDGGKVELHAEMSEMKQGSKEGKGKKNKRDAS